MKIERIEMTKTPMDIAITEARLLTKEEAEALPERLRRYLDFWWTSTADAEYTFRAWMMNGNLCYLIKRNVNVETVARPALIFELSSLKIGDRFIVADLEFEVISEGLAFCTTDIGKCAFRKDWDAKDANQYEASDIKKYIDKWFEENVK